MSKRLGILKTYKLYIDGNFSRTESGRYYVAKGPNGEVLGNCCLASRKDFRNAIVAARKAQGPWAERSAYNISQILYRIGENFESRMQEVAELLVKEDGISISKATNQLEKGIDRIIYFAGWADKYQQIFSSVNPVASSHFNFSMLEPTGVVASICDEKSRFLGLISATIVTICAGNSIVILANQNSPLSAITFAEILHHSDVPSGLVNILTGTKEELEEQFVSHMDVNTLLLIGDDFSREQIDKVASENLKRIRQWPSEFIAGDELESPYSLKDLLEVKTTWHPIEQIGGAKAGY